MKKTMIALLGFLLLIMMMGNALAVTINDIAGGDEVMIQLGNKYYKFDNPYMNFTQILVYGTYIYLNDTYFSMTGDSINMTITYLRPSMTASEDVTIISFTASSTGDSATITISGLPIQTQYTINRDGVFWRNIQSDISGTLAFIESDWSTHDYDIIVGATVEPPVSVIESLDPLNMTEFLENPWDTAYSPFTDFFEDYVGVGNAFWLFLLVVFTIGIYIKTEGNGVMASMFMIASGATLGSANIFLNQPDMSFAFYIFCAMGIAGLFVSIIFQNR